MAVAGAITCAALAGTNAANAQTVTVTALSVPTGATVVTGNQDFGGTVGNDFNVLSPTGITVTQLGVFDSGQNGLSRTLTARLFQLTSSTTGSELGSAIFTAADPGTLVGAYRFKTLTTPIFLATGTQASIATDGYGAGELLLNETNRGAGDVILLDPATDGDSAGDLIDFVGTGRFSDGFDVGFPDKPDDVGKPGTADGVPFAGGNLVFTAVPEPTALALLGLAAPLLAGRRRRHV